MADDYQPPERFRELYESSKRIAFLMARRKQMQEITQYLHTSRRERGKTEDTEAFHSSTPQRWPSENLGSLTGEAAEAVIRGQEAGIREAEAITLEADFKQLLRGVVNSEREKMAQQDGTQQQTRQAVINAADPVERERRLDAILTEGAKGLAGELHLRQQFDRAYRNQ